MSSVDVKDHEGTVTASVVLPDDVFDVQANIPLMHQVVVAQLAAARQGSIRAPQFTGGGVVHGPVPRDYTQRVNKKMKAAALRGALSDRAREGRLHVVESFVDGETPKTKDALGVLGGLTEAKRVLVVLSRDDDVNWLSLRNLPQVHLLVADQLNTYDVLLADDVVFTADALNEFLAGPSTTPSAADESDEEA
jgi:large subunit ribosomal protein L4